MSKGRNDKEGEVFRAFLIFLVFLVQTTSVNGTNYFDAQKEGIIYEFYFVPYMTDTRTTRVRRSVSKRRFFWNVDKWIEDEVFLVFLVFLFFLFRQPMLMAPTRKIITTLQRKEETRNFHNQEAHNGDRSNKSTSFYFEEKIFVRYGQMNRRWSVSCFSCFPSFSCADHLGMKSYFDAPKEGTRNEFYLFLNMRDPRTTRERRSVSKRRFFGDMDECIKGEVFLAFLVFLVFLVQTT